MTDLRTAAQQALEALEAIREADTAGATPKMVVEARKMYEPTITALRAALAEHDKKIVWVEERKAHWAEQLQLARETQERERQQREEAALAEPVQEEEGLIEFLADLQRSRMKYPNNRRMFDGLMSEVDELRRAYAGDGDIRAEAFDVAVCAFRIATEGDSGGNTMLKQAEPVQEPVAWSYEWKHRLHGGSLNVSRARWPESDLWIETPLYAAPLQRKPLTEEEIAELARQEQFLLICDGLEELTEITRSVERAHDIT